MTRSPRRAALARTLAVLLAFTGLSGCAAVSALSGASAPLDAYTLTPLEGAGGAAGSRHVVVEAPTSSGAIATDRILVKPNRLRAAYLPEARWVDPAPAMVQTVMVQSLQASGAFRLVGRTTLGLFPDYTLLTELTAFQAELGPEGGPLYIVRAALTLTMIREDDGVVVASRRFEGRGGANSADPLVLVVAFDAAMGQVLREATPWIARTAGGGV